MSKCKALHNRCFVECKKKILNITHVCSEVVRLVLEYTQECDYIWLKGFFFRIHECLEDCIHDCSLAISDELKSSKTNPRPVFLTSIITVLFDSDLI